MTDAMTRDRWPRMSFRQWLHAWKVTLKIKYFEPELYRHLKGPIDPADFVEVPRPTPEAKGD